MNKFTLRFINDIILIGDRKWLKEVELKKK